MDHTPIAPQPLPTDATLTTQGRITLPKEIRERAGLKAGDKLTFTALSDGAVVVRAKDRRLLDQAGILTRPGQPNVGIDEMRPWRG